MKQREPQKASNKKESKKWRRAIVYMVWGDKCIKEAINSATSALFMKIPIVLITDIESKDFIPEKHPFHQIKIVDKFRSKDHLNKSTLWDHLPDEYDSFLYLDADTTILKDITFGFNKAEKHGFAASQATNYSLPDHHEFRRIMTAYEHPDAGQIQYNAGVYFFARRPRMKAVFKQYQNMAYNLSGKFHYRNPNNKTTDQPFLSFALEKLNFNPYTLSINYCYRGLDAEPICGDIRIWHSHHPVPKNINQYDDKGKPRRRYYAGTLINMQPVYEMITAKKPK